MNIAPVADLSDLTYEENSLVQSYNANPGCCPSCGCFFTALGFDNHICKDFGPAPYCACGCGEQVKDCLNGIWSRWRPNHWQRGVNGFAYWLDRRIDRNKRPYHRKKIRLAN